MVGGGKPLCMRAASPKAVDRCSSDLKLPLAISAGITFSYSSWARLRSDTRVVNERSPKKIGIIYIALGGSDKFSNLLAVLMVFVLIAPPGHCLSDKDRALIHRRIISALFP